MFRLYLIDPELVFADARGYGTVQPQVKYAEGRVNIKDAVSGRTFSKIGGMEPMQWLSSLVSSPVLLLPFKVRRDTNYLLASAVYKLQAMNYNMCLSDGAPHCMCIHPIHWINHHGVSGMVIGIASHLVCLVNSGRYLGILRLHSKLITSKLRTSL